jgi:hypothetical protein
MRRFLSACLLILVSTSLLQAQGSSIGSATAIAPNGNAGGTINDQSTNHYWKVTTASDGYLRFQIASTSTIDVDVLLFDTDGTTTIMSDYQSGPNSEVFGFLKPGTYYLLVYRWTGTSGSYTVTSSFSSPVKPQDAESNNTPATAVVLSPTGSSTGHLGYYSAGQTDNDDYWKITTTQDGWLRVQVQSDSLDARGDQRFDLDVILYDVNGSTSIASDYRSGTFSQVDNFVRPGTYYVRVYRWTGRAGTYDIKSEFFTPPLSNDAEGNDSYQTAITVAVNSSVTGHLGYYSSGVTDSDDYWKFTTAADGRIVVTAVSDSLDRSGVRFDLDMIIYDVNGTTSIASDYRSGTVSECILFLRPGTYYARVYRWTGNGASYRFSVAQTNPPRGNDVEGNDWFSLASTLSLNITSTGHLGYYSNGTTDTEDRWRFVATSTDSVYFHITSDSTIDLDVVAYAPDTTSSISADYRYGTYSRVAIKPTSGSSYYLKVYRWSGTAGSYSILASRSSATVGVQSEPTAALVPGELYLDQNYPNPFNPTTTIQYGLPETQSVRITVYSLLGQEIAVLLNAVQSPGSYRVVWNGRDARGMEMSSGMYIVRLQAGDTHIARKVMLLR